MLQEDPEDGSDQGNDGYPRLSSGEYAIMELRGVYVCFSSSIINRM